MPMIPEIEYTDRYGGNWPDPETVCNGPCEGMGFYPEPKIRNEDGTIPIEHNEWDFIKCPDCNGTGKRAQKIGD